MSHQSLRLILVAIVALTLPFSGYTEQSDLPHIEEQLSAARELLREWPHRVEPRLALARLLIENGTDAEAMDLLEEVVLLQPSCPLAYLPLASLFARHGRSDRAIPLLEVLTRLEPSDRRAILFLGDLYLSEGVAEGAVASYRRALTDWHGDGPTWNRLARALLAMGRLGEALEATFASSNMEPGHAPPWVTAGRIHLLRMAPHRALQAFERAYELDSACEEAIEGLVHTLKMVGRDDEAAQLRTGRSSVFFPTSQGTASSVVFGSVPLNPERRIPCSIPHRTCA